jgi:hypothetical protein
LDDECARIRRRRHTLLNDSPAILVELWRLRWCGRPDTFFDHGLALLKYSF